MKMSKQTFLTLKTALESKVDTSKELTPTEMWNHLADTGMWNNLYKEGLNDSHIETALRKIFLHVAWK